MNRNELLNEMERLLIAAIPKQVQALRVREPMYCMRLWYYGSDTPAEFLSFKLTLKPASLRTRLISEQGPGAPHYLWCADECESGSGVINSEILDPTIMKDYRAWGEEVFGGDGLPDDNELVPLREMTQRVAKVLNKINWSPFCSVTDDFVIFPADGSHSFMADFDELTASVPPERLELLRKRRFLGLKEWYKL